MFKFNMNIWLFQLRLRLSESRVLGKIFGRKWDEVAGEWKNYITRSFERDITNVFEDYFHWHRSWSVPMEDNDILHVTSLSKNFRRALPPVFSPDIIQVNQIKKNEMGGAYSMCGGGRGSYRDLVERQITVPPHSTQMQRGLTKYGNRASAVRNVYYTLEPWHGGSKVPICRIDAGCRSLCTIRTTHGLYPSLIPG
jgi:hypothetical protein